MLKHRWNYWSCSKLADWVRGEKKPKALTMEEWRDWKNKLKTNSPFRYFVAEKLLNKIQDILFWPSDLFESVKSYVDNRFITKTHYLKTGLKPGDFHELDERILYGLFNELKNFIECEQAWIYSIGFDKKYTFKKGRCIEAGMDYLDWASNLKLDETCGMEKDHPDYGKPTRQALAAVKILELYNWWKNRPNRIDPMTESGWSKYCENREPFSSFDENGKEILEKLHKLEEDYEKEDETMLIKLIKLRKNLWT